MQWTGKASDGTEVAGKVVVPEVSHEVTVDHLSDYVASAAHSYNAFRASNGPLWLAVRVVFDYCAFPCG